MANSSNAAPELENQSENGGLINFYDPKTEHDKVFVVEGKKFYVQSTILRIFSDYHLDLFKSNSTEANKNKIILKDVKADHFEIFLKLMYKALKERVESPVLVDTSVLLGLMSLALRFNSPFVSRTAKKEIDANIASHGMEKFDLIEFCDILIRYDIMMVEYREVLFKSLRDVAFASKKKQEIMKAPENIRNFMLEAYLDGKMVHEAKGTRATTSGSGGRKRRDG